MKHNKQNSFNQTGPKPPNKWQPREKGNHPQRNFKQRPNRKNYRHHSSRYQIVNPVNDGTTPSTIPESPDVSNSENRVKVFLRQLISLLKKKNLFKWNKPAKNNGEVR